MKLSIIIVNYNVSHFLEQALLSLKKASIGPEMEIIVVDNHSVDRSVDMIRSKFPHVILIENNNNLGFSKANNQGINIAKGEYVLLLNPDTVVEEDTLKKCCNFMEEHPEAGGLGVMMVDGKGEFLPESKRGLPTPWVAFYKVFGLAALFPKSKKFGKYHLGFLNKDQTHEIEVLSGAYMFLRKEALNKVGLLDEDYFMYGEDIDLSYRITQGGYKNYYYPETRIIHYKGESTKKTSLNYVFVFYKAMIIFAQKRFSRQGAAIFSVLINIAIYLRAGLAVCIRFVKISLMPVTDFFIIYAGLYLLKIYWEENYKKVNYYPPEYLQIVIPSYIIVWIATLYISGGYDKSVRTSQIVRGIAIGTLVISAISNFIEIYRFSKALIIMGSIWTIIAVALIRISNHFLLYGNFALGESPRKKIIIIGNPKESLRAINLLRGSNYKFDILGYISTVQSVDQDDLYLGKIEQMEQIIKIYQIDEIIFCSKDFSANQIIEWMMNIHNEFLEYKILPDESNYIIGSNSKNTSGDFYTLNLDLNIIQKSAIRNKRIIDIALSLLFLLLSPLLLWTVEKPARFFKNIFNVLKGRYTWVGFSNTITVALPKIKSGIITPVTHISINKLDQSTINKLNLLYAKNYNAFIDLDLVFKSYKNLDT
jgi:GT2 family glycosyltransferase